MNPVYLLSDLTHSDRVALYCTGAITELARANKVETTTLLTPAGLALWDQLQASGFRPTEPDVWGWLAATSPWLPVAAAQGVVRMVLRLEEVRKEIEEQQS